MNVEEAKELVCESGKRLKTSGLVAGTWGNISQRVDENTMVITPSGMDYETASPDDMSVVDLNEMTYEGPKPSTEKKIHAQIYLSRHEVNAILHTHSMNASTVAAAHREVPPMFDEMAEKIGKSVRIAEYGIPGTSKLADGTLEGIKGRNGVILANHGALCVGADMDDAFSNAKILEDACEKFIKSEAGVELETAPLGSTKIISFSKRLDDDSMEISAADKEYDNVEADNLSVVNIENLSHSGPEPAKDMKLHAAIYGNRKKINAMLHVRSPNISAAVAKNEELPPILDDMAQIVGPTIRIAEYPDMDDKKMIKKAVKSLKRRNGVLLTGGDAICIGRDMEEAFTTLTVLEKSCKAFAEAQYLGGTEKIGKIEAWIMHLYYMKKYGKK